MDLGGRYLQEAINAGGTVQEYYNFCRIFVEDLYPRIKDRLYQELLMIPSTEVEALREVTFKAKFLEQLKSEAAMLFHDARENVQKQVREVNSQLTPENLTRPGW